MSRKRERENPCFVCNHYHDYANGEPCSICGHAQAPVEKIKASAFPSEIIQDFLYLGSYDNATRSELLKAIGVKRILNVRAMSPQGLSHRVYRRFPARGPSSHLWTFLVASCGLPGPHSALPPRNAAGPGLPEPVQEHVRVLRAPTDPRGQASRGSRCLR